MFIASVILLPAFLLGLLLVAAWLENHVVAPHERATAIKDLLTNRSSAEEIEHAAVRLLRTCDRPKRVVRQT